MSNTWIKQNISNTTDITRLILETGDFVKETGFDIASCDKIKVVVSELGHNIIKYAGKGSITVSRVKIGLNKGVEIIARDNGPGIKDIELAMQDNFSTGKTLGLGLPGIKRIVDEFHITSDATLGTTIEVKKWL